MRKRKIPTTNSFVSDKILPEEKKLFFQKSEVWLAKNQKLILVSIISISVIFRSFYFIQLNNGPCIWQHRYEESDMNFYDRWAKIISQGDWLSGRPFHQYDVTHQWIADYYFKTHPDEAVQLQKQLGTDKSPDALGRLLWHRWDGGKIFHQDPLYIYVVAVIYKIFGEDVRYVFVLQMVIGIFSVLLIYLITRKHFGTTAALVSGVFATCCGPMMFYELVLVRETMIVFAGLLLVFLMDKALEKPTAKNFIVLGITIAICILLKSVFILFLFLTIVLTFFIFRNQLKLFLRYSLILSGAAFITYSPLIVRNSIVGAPLLSQNSIGAFAVIASNDVNYDPSRSYSLNLKTPLKFLKQQAEKHYLLLLPQSKHTRMFSVTSLYCLKNSLLFFTGMNFQIIKIFITTVYMLLFCSLLSLTSYLLHLWH